MNRSKPRGRGGRPGRGTNEKNEETNFVAPPQLDRQPGHARQEISEAVFAPAREPGTIA
ncbi:MAG TPA: hypothetical protein VN887_07450 [Candidatus Angelobacter sp.]|nr:hypothetical protein [Candidatus Angelobacter sp.]